MPLLHVAVRGPESGSPTRSWPHLLRALLVAPCLWAGACAGPEVASYNLDELLRTEGGFRYTARIENAYQFIIRQMIRPKWLGNGSLEAPDEEPVENPTQVALENLLLLAEDGAESSSPWEVSEQVRQFARYALECPSSLARERCFIELARHARRLDLGEPLRSLPNPADSDEVADALAQVVHAHRGLVDAEGPLEDRLAQLESACDRCGAMTLDMAGGWRLLKAVASLARGGDPGDPAISPLLDLATDLQTHLVSMALAIGLSDPIPRVRAAAWRANYTAYGDVFLAEALASLVMPARRADGSVARTPRFGLPPQPGSAEDVYLAMFDIVRADGLPESVEAVEPGDAERIRASQLFVLVQVAHDISAYGDRTRTAAMQTLGAISGSGVTGLRKEVWEDWWEAYLAGEASPLVESPELGNSTP